jgi:hypothetical protein
MALGIDQLELNLFVFKLLVLVAVDLVTVNLQVLVDLQNGL